MRRNGSPSPARSTAPLGLSTIAEAPVSNGKTIDCERTTRPLGSSPNDATSIVYVPPLNACSSTGGSFPELQDELLAGSPVDFHLEVPEIGVEILDCGFLSLLVVVLGHQLHRDVGLADAPVEIRHEAAEQNPEVQVLQAVAEKQDRRASERALDHARQKRAPPRDGHEKVEIVVLGEDERIGHLVVAVQVVYDRPIDRRHVVRLPLEHGHVVLGDVVIPFAQLAFGPLVFLACQRLAHERIVVGRDVRRDGEGRQDVVGFVLLARIGLLPEHLELAYQLGFGIGVVVVFRRQELRDPREIVLVLEGKPLLLRPTRRDLGAERNVPIRGAGAEKRSAASIPDARQQHRPGSIIQSGRFAHDGSGSGSA
jgi:hypothetical protein